MSFLFSQNAAFSVCSIQQSYQSTVCICDERINQVEESMSIYIFRILNINMIYIWMIRRSLCVQTIDVFIHSSLFKICCFTCRMFTVSSKWLTQTASDRLLKLSQISSKQENWINQIAVIRTWRVNFFWQHNLTEKQPSLNLLIWLWKHLSTIQSSQSQTHCYLFIR